MKIYVFPDADPVFYFASNSSNSYDGGALGFTIPHSASFPAGTYVADLT